MNADRAVEIMVRRLSEQVVELDDPANYDSDEQRERALAFRNEADPLFFKWQRGERTEQAWLDKVAEIRARFPDPEPVDDDGGFYEWDEDGQIWATVNPISEQGDH